MADLRLVTTPMGEQVRQTARVERLKALTDGLQEINEEVDAGRMSRDVASQARVELFQAWFEFERSVA